MKPDHTKELFRFLSQSPTCYHAAEQIAQRLTASGFSELREGEKWNLSRGGAYFLRRNLSTLIAFRVPDGELRGVTIAASHSDSPAFKIKENCEITVDGAYTKLNVEQYGGAICAGWFDRPLSAAGKVVVRDGDTLVSRLVCIDRDLLMIPSLAIHMNRSVNDGYAIKVQRDMLPLIGGIESKGALMRLIAQEAGTEEIIASDLFLYCRTPAVVWGANDEFISAPRLDDLQCTFANLQGFLAGKHPETLSVYAVFDNEEVGSSTKQGAASTVLYDTLRRVNEALGGNEESYLRALASGFMVSADNGHAVHPNHTEKADPTNHPHMNKGVVIKFSAPQRYTTDAVSASIFRELCRRADVPTQNFVNHSDITGGSTLGHLAMAQVSLNSVDIGLAQLAMHAPYETAGAHDTEYLIRAMTEFFSTRIEECGQGTYRLLKA